MDKLGARIGILLRFGKGATVAPGLQSAGRRHVAETSPVAPPSPPKLTLYDFESSPWCRRVRETIAELDLEVSVRPCPRLTVRVEGAASDATRFRMEAANRFGKERLQFPLLVDETKPGNPMVLNESSDIVAHLWTRYGEGGKKGKLEAFYEKLPKLMIFPSLVAPSLLRLFPSAGIMLTPSDDSAVKQPLSLYGAEGCAETKLIREALCTLQIPYTYKCAAIGSCRRGPGTTLGHRRVLLVDPNTNIIGGKTHATKNGTVEIDNCDVAVTYLADTYQRGRTYSLVAPIPVPNFGQSRPLSRSILSALAL